MGDWLKEKREEKARIEENLRVLNTSLRSRAYLKVIDAISEGEVDGLVNGDKSVFLNETQLQNESGTYNFQNVDVVTRNGTQSQTYISGFEAVENEVSLGTEIIQSTPITFTITDSDINAARVVIQFGSLIEQSSNGDLLGARVEFKIELQSNGGGFAEVLRKEVVGKSSNVYETSYRIELTGSAPWDIKVTRITADSTSTIQNRSFLKSYTAIIDSKLRYPNTALVATKIDAAQFGNIPSRSYEIKGIKVLIPDNYNPTTRVYTGVWSGAFAASKAYTNNPAWVYLDMLTNSRYGCGNFINTSQIDKFSLYEIAQYCDELVPDGTGSFEPRFTCNVAINNQEEAYNILQNLTSVFRGMAYWASGSITNTQDRPGDAEYLFTNANVVDGTFNYQGASAKALHTVCTVKWTDPSDFYREKIEWIEDQEAVAERGIVTTDIVAFGCTSRGQANRLGRWLLYSEQNESRVVTFKTGSEGAILRPGQIIKVADSLIAGNRIGGRIASATTTTVTLDKEYELSIVGGEISCILPNGTVETKPISSMVGTLVTITGTFSVAPNSHSMWVISTSSVDPQDFRVVSVLESEDGTYETTAVSYNPSKYAFVENGLDLEERNITNLSVKPDSPTNLAVTESLFEYTSIVRSKAVLSWDKVPNAVSYQVQYSRDDENIILLPEQGMNELEIFDVVPGTYYFTVVAINFLGGRSIGSSIETQLFGKLTPPGNVQNFSLFPNANAAFFTWTKSVDLDVVVGGFVRIRHTPRTSGQTWGSAIDVIDFVPGSDTFATAPLLPGTYMAKFVDSTGNESVTESLALTTVPLPVGLNVVETVVETDLFEGTHVNTGFIPGLGLTLLTDEMWDDMGLIDSELGPITWGGEVLPSGSYYFRDTIDLGQVFTSNLTAHIKTLAFDIGVLWDDILDSIDTWTDITGSSVASVNAKLYVRTTEGNPNYVVTRNSIGTYYDSNGYVKTAAVDVARVTYNPLDLSAFPTLLTESASTNLFTQSADLSHVDWQPGGTSNYTRVANVGTGPDGTNGSTLLTVKSGLTSFSTSAPSQYLTKAASVKTYTFSLYVKDNGAGGLRVRFFFDAGTANFINGTYNLQTGTLVAASSGGTASSPSGTISSVGHGWYRVTLTGTSDTSTILRTQIFCGNTTGSSFTGDDIKGTYMWGAQLEEAAAATSHIPTTTAAVTREADVLVSSPDWTAWKPFLTGSYLARAYQFRIDLTSGVTTQNIAVEELEVTIDMPDRTESHEGLVSGLVDPFHFDFDYDFNVVPAIGIITHDMVSGDYYTITNKTSSGFDIVFKNSSNTVVSRTFDVVIKGYGLKG